MRRLKKGQRIKAICPSCKEIVWATMKLKRYHAGKYYIKDILMGCCDKCGRAIALPHQEVAKIRKALDEKGG